MGRHERLSAFPTGDWNVLPDLAGIAEGIRHSLKELRE
jgi:hypothetical protein